MSDAAAELARLVEEVSGNVVPPAHLPFLAQAAAARVLATGHRDLAAYVASLRRGALASEWSALLPLVTVNESYLYRTPQHFAALERVLLPELTAARADSRRLRLWSAGCARGEEPATLAIVLAETPALAGWDWLIVATDVDEEALAAARRGRFGERAVANVPPEQRERHLERRGGEYVLAPALRARIEYHVLNLVHEPLVATGAPFDLVFLRNVLIYFRPESQRRVAAAVAQHLAPDGRLFLGPAETLWQLTDAIEPVDLGDSFCYRRREAGSGVRGQGSGKGTAEVGSRVRGQGSGRGKAEAGSAVRGQGSERRRVVVDSRSSRPLTPDPGLLGTTERLAEAARHLLSDRLADAAVLLDQVLAADPSVPEAHALEGFIHDISGRTELAIASFRAALYLDARLYQVRLLLADALRRLGWDDRAAVEYRAVLLRLAAGDAAELAALSALPLPNHAGAAQRARAALLPR
jgi:chemotaxis protein methyltransferase CheR